MGTITAIEEQKHDPERVSIFVDGRFAAGVTRLVLAGYRLRVGDSIDAETLEQIEHDDQIERTYGAALNFLSFRPRSRREIDQYFRRKNVPDDIATAVVEKLERLRFIDDREFAHFWVENRQTFRPRGVRALKAEMRFKGLSSEVIDEALEDLDDEEITAYEVAKKKARSYDMSDEREFSRRLIGFLQRRGFGYGVAAGAARRILAEGGAESPDDLAPE